MIDTNAGAHRWIGWLLEDIETRGPCLRKISFDVYVQNRQQLTNGPVFEDIKKFLQRRVRTKHPDDRIYGRTIEKVILLLKSVEDHKGMALPFVFMHVNAMWRDFIQSYADAICLKEASLFSGM